MSLGWWGATKAELQAVEQGMVDYDLAVSPLSPFPLASIGPASRCPGSAMPPTTRCLTPVPHSAPLLSLTLPAPQTRLIFGPFSFPRPASQMAAKVHRRQKKTQPGDAWGTTPPDDVAQPDFARVGGKRR